MDKKLTPIWDELSAIGEAAPTGTWDAVPENLSTLIDNAYDAYAECIQSDRQKTREINVLVPENRALRAENESLKLAHARYEYVRCLSPSSFKELWKANIRGEGAFDDLVDKLIKAAHRK